MLRAIARALTGPEAVVHYNIAPTDMDHYRSLWSLRQTNLFLGYYDAESWIPSTSNPLPIQFALVIAAISPNYFRTHTTGD